MEIPKFHETFIPILKVLSDEKIIHYNDLRKKVRDEFYSNLPNELLNKKTKSGDILILNRIGWGKGYLKQAKLIHQPKRALVQITEKGKKVLEKGIYTLKDLKKDSDYLLHEKSKENNKDLDSFDKKLQNASPQDLIDSGFSSIESQTKSDLLEKLKGIDPYYFEKVILILLNKMGYGEFVETSKSGDGGIDGIINKDKLGLEKIYIQAKRYNDNKVREKDIRNFIGAMSGDTSKGVFVTTSSFDAPATQKAQEAHHKIILIDGLTLASLMYEYCVGLQIRNTYEVKDIDDDFFEDN
jgi:restriction system protein